jgi:hypothetical protein
MFGGVERVKTKEERMRREYAALQFERPVRPPVSGYDRDQPSMKQRVAALLAKQAETRECVRRARLKKAIAETPPEIQREVRLRAAMWEWLVTQAKLEAGR